MSPNPSPSSPNLGKPLHTEGVHPPVYNPTGAEAATPQSTTSPEFQPETQFDTNILAFLYTIVFIFTTVGLCWLGSYNITVQPDEQQQAFARLIYASLLGSIVLGPILFTNRRFSDFKKAKAEAFMVHTANGRLLEALKHISFLYIVIVIGASAIAATVGYGLIFWPLVYSESLSTMKMVEDAAIIPLACFLGGFRLLWAVYNILLWTLIRVPKISGLEGEKYDKLIKTGCGFALVYFIGSCLMLTVFSIAFTLFACFFGAFVSPWTVLVLWLTPSLMDKIVACFDRYREPVELPASV